MTTTNLHGNNRLIRKTILKMFPSGFAANLTVSIALMVDTLLAGAMLGQQAIAAVAIGLPAIGIFQALTQTVISGAGIKLAVYAGRGDQKKLNQTYSLGMASTVALGLFFILVSLLLAKPLTGIFGGAGNPAVAEQAAVYLRASSVCVLMGSLNTFLGKVLSLYGHQKYVFRSALIAMIGNIVFSILYIRLLPAELAIAGLGAGTWTGGALASLSSLIAIKKEKIPLRFRAADADVKELPTIVKLGFPTSANKLADNLVAGIVNNIIVGGFGGDTMALSVYTAVKGVISFLDTAIATTTTAATPLLGILYGSRDRNGLIRTVKECLKIGLVAIAVWGVILWIALPWLAQFYSMDGVPHFHTGYIFGLVWAPLWLLVHVMTQMLESTERTGVALMFSSIPDSLIYPVLLALLLPLMQYNGIWLAYNANAVLFLLALYIIRSLKHKSWRISADRTLFLDQDIREHAPVLDISIRSNNTDVTGVSQKVQQFLEEQNVSSRTAYMTSLCLEELAADFVAHTMQEDGKNADRTIMDIKLFSDEDSLQIIIRNAASAYNPLNFELDDETFAKVGVKLAQKVARNIQYTYVYKMNIITIDLAK